MRALPGTPVGGLFPPRLPSAIGEGQPLMAEHRTRSVVRGTLHKNSALEALDTCETQTAGLVVPKPPPCLAALPEHKRAL